MNQTTTNPRASRLRVLFAAVVITLGVLLAASTLAFQSYQSNDHAKVIDTYVRDGIEAGTAFLETPTSKWNPQWAVQTHTSPDTPTTGLRVFESGDESIRIFYIDKLWPGDKKRIARVVGVHYFKVDQNVSGEDRWLCYDPESMAEYARLSTNSDGD